MNIDFSYTHVSEENNDNRNENFRGHNLTELDGVTYHEDELNPTISLGEPDMDALLNPESDAELDYSEALERYKGDFEVPVHRGEMLEDFDGTYLPDITVSDVRQEQVFDLNNVSPIHEARTINGRVKSGLKKDSYQVRNIRFYQVPAPIATEDLSREKQYMEELFIAQNSLNYDRDLLKNPRILLETGSEDTILYDVEDATRIRKHHDSIKERYEFDIGFLVDFHNSEEPEEIIEELSEYNVEKLRGTIDHLPEMEEFEDSVETISIDNEI